MIDRKLLELEEITWEEYFDIKSAIARQKQKEHLLSSNILDKPNNSGGFSKITNPLRFESYQHVLYEFMITERSKRATVMLRPKLWRRVKTLNLNKRNIRELVAVAEKTGFLYISFLNLNGKDTDNEIGFEPDDKGVISVCLTIPGEPLEERLLYDWHGSNTAYSKISGLYPPKSI